MLKRTLVNFLELFFGKLRNVFSKRTTSLDSNKKESHNLAVERIALSKGKGLRELSNESSKIRKRLGSNKRDLIKNEDYKKNLKKLKIKSKKLEKEIILNSPRKSINNVQIIKGDLPILTGIKGFDVLFDNEHGIPSGASVLIEGGPGSGKTIFCLTTLNELCKKGKKGLYMSFEEPEKSLIDHMERFGWNPRKHIKDGNLRIKRFDAIDVSRSVEALLSAAKKELLIEVDPVFFPKDYSPDFIVIDSLTSISSAFSGQESRFRVYMEQLFRYLEKNKITNFLIREVSAPSHVGTSFKEQGEAVSFLSDGIIIIYNVIHNNGKRSSAIEILKMRGSSFKKRIVEMKILDGKGLFVYPKKILKKGDNYFELT